MTSPAALVPHMGAPTVPAHTAALAFPGMPGRPLMPTMEPPLAPPAEHVRHAAHAALVAGPPWGAAAVGHVAGFAPQGMPPMQQPAPPAMARPPAAVVQPPARHPAVPPVPPWALASVLPPGPGQAQAKAQALAQAQAQALVQSQVQSKSQSPAHAQARSLAQLPPPMAPAVPSSARSGFPQGSRAKAVAAGPRLGDTALHPVLQTPGAAWTAPQATAPVPLQGQGAAWGSEAGGARMEEVVRQREAEAVLAIFGEVARRESCSGNAEQDSQRRLAAYSALLLGSAEQQTEEEEAPWRLRKRRRTGSAAVATGEPAVVATPTALPPVVSGGAG
mmetsp:Transcript_109132/g.341429  ORF Transcript_109132/g.341429 Transcript_109132/m.341429 type:complete len:333 (-) Transcript_109132:104-1102(-)